MIDDVRHAQVRQKKIQNYGATVTKPNLEGEGIKGSIDLKAIWTKDTSPQECEHDCVRRPEDRTTSKYTVPLFNK